MTSDAADLVRRYLESVWNRGDFAELDQLTTADFAYYLGGHPPRDRAAMKQFLSSVRVAFPDWRVDVVDLIASDHSVAVRWQGQVTHQGVFQGIPPTGKRVTVSGINIYRVIDGRISAEWEQMDSLGMLAQLGVLKPS
jgi:steroid delta-isomerase-like uncharacterized protein